ncbi:MAG: hypothetical protein K6F29_08755 [Bacteroidales bacterium]|nr:hypothetical protein [Bacteroidales bacterium]
MAQTFNEITRNIVDRFLQNILFVDDNAYPTIDKQKVNAFDAHKISSVFAQKGKLCAIYAPSTEEDLKNCSSMFAKSDVVILDWYLDLENEQLMEDAEKDADSEEPRGIYTTKLINNIIEEAGDKKLKLIVVYTGETDLTGITEDLYKGITLKEQFEQGDCCVSSSNVTIFVRAKYKDDNQFKHNSELQSKIVKYENLPDFITTEFSNFVGGLLPDFALSAITSIRDNTSNILGVFSKDIDPAFLGQYVSIPDCNDAISMLSEIFGSAITDLIDSNNFDIKTWIDTWLTQNFKEPFKAKIGKKEVEICESNLRDIVNSEESKFSDKLKTIHGISGKEDELKKDATKLFIEHSDMPNYKLAKLIQHSNLFSPSKAPRLTTGTIVKYKRENNWKFLLCIQQRCDSVRIPKEGRTFLFLPLTQNIKGTAVVVGEMKHMIVEKESHSIELHEFIPENDKELSITAKQYKRIGYAFKDKTGKYYIWVAELKEMFAQNIVTTYASQLSRVGIDDSEWIRLVGKMN